MCKLSPDPAGTSDAIGPVGATATVLVTSGDAPTMRIVNAFMNGAPVLPVVDGRVVLPPLPAGNNVLDLHVLPGQTGDEVVLTEDCLDGTTRPLKRRFIGGGGDPHVGYTIHAE